MPHHRILMPDAFLIIACGFGDPVVPSPGGFPRISEQSARPSFISSKAYFHDFPPDPGCSTVPKPSQTDASNLTSGIEDYVDPIEQALRAAVQFDSDCPSRLAEAIRYALLAPGKRLRPALVLMAAEACGGSIEQAMPGAVAVEMIHAYSLIHDDLPAMDDDDLRRGRPTLHIAFDEATAILAGDALLSEAFHQLSRGIDDPSRGLEAVQVLSHAAGACRLVGGQADDLAAESRIETPAASGDTGTVGSTKAPRDADDRLADLQLLESIHRRKTGALIAASLELGAIISGAKSSQRQSLVDYAMQIGLAFQVVDDLLDFTANEAVLGKRVRKDADRGKLTYPGLLGIDEARHRARSLIDSAQERIGIFGKDGWRLICLANYILERSH